MGSTWTEAELERAGLLPAQGVLDAPARGARVRLLRALLQQGFAVEELRTAADQGRLVLLPLERALRGDVERATSRDVSARTGLSLEQMEQLRATLGLTRLGPDEPELTGRDEEAIRQAAAAVAAGLPFEGVLEVNTALASGMPGLAATLRHLAATVVVTTDDEEQLALELARAAADLLPLLVPVLEYALRAHLERQVVADYVDTRLDRSEGSPQCVAFADLTGFTRLSQSQQPQAVGELAGRLTQAARAVTAGRVRLVKTIGDAVMLTAPTPAELAHAVLDLVDAVAASDGLPAVRAGMAHGPVLQRAGDLFGRPVNLASRLAGVAGDGELVCDAASRDALRAGSDLLVVEREAVVVKGIDDPQRVAAVTRLRAAAQD